MMDCKNTIKRKKAGIWRAVVLMLFLCMTVIVSGKMPGGTVQAEASGDYRYEVDGNGTTVTITRYTGSATTLIIPSTLDGKSVTCIGEFAFWGCSSLTSISIPDSVTSIGGCAFWECSSLTSISIPDSVTSIGDYAFENCSGLTSISIPDSVTSIEDNVFSGCSELKNIQVASGNTKYDSRDNCNAIIDKATNTLIVGCKNTIIPSSVTSIGSYAFIDCSGLTSISIPDSVTSIGDYAFENCSGLTSISISDSVASIGLGAFKGCSSLTSIGIPDSVTSIGERAFENCSGLTSISIPSSVTNIAPDAFSGCPRTIIIYADTGSYAAMYAAAYGLTVKPIENYSTTPTTPSTGDEGTKPADTSTSPTTGNEETKPTGTPTTPSTGDKDTKPADLPTTPATGNNHTPAASGTVLTVSNSQCKVKVNSGNAANPTVTYTDTTNKTAAAVTVPATVTVDNVTYKVTGIADNAFKNNKKVTKITIGTNVTTIGEKAFYGCKNLKNITIKTTKLTVKKIGSKAFKGIHAKATIKVPKKKLADYKKILKKKGIGSKVKIKK